MSQRPGRLVATLLALCLIGLTSARASEAPTSASDANTGLLSIYVFSVGSGVCIVVACPNGARIVNDCGTISRNGSTTAAVSYASRMLAQAPADQRYVLLSHPDLDHYNLLRNLGYEDDPGNMTVVYGGQVGGYRGFKTTDWIKAAADFQAPAPSINCASAAGDGVYILTNLVGRSANDNSAVAQYRLGSTRILVMGDATGVTEAAMLSKARKLRAPLFADMLVASHHGAITSGSNSQALAAAVRPGVLVFSAGGRFGHPRCASRDVYLHLRPPSLKVSQAHTFTCYYGVNRPAPPMTYDLALYGTDDGESAIVFHTDGQRVSWASCPNNSEACLDQSLEVARTMLRQMVASAGIAPFP